VVVADEGTKIKGEDTLIGKGTRQMNPKYRLPMTATPIKNRLPDVFRLAHWATGAHHRAHPRFPFGDDDRDTFAEEFSVSERNLSAEDRSESGRRFVKLTPQVCSIHQLWKLLCPIILRRRKKDCGEALVTKTRHVVRVPMGQAQAAVYKFHLEAEYKDKNDRPAIGAKLQALRIAAANPASLLLTRQVPTPTPQASRAAAMPISQNWPVPWPLSRKSSIVGNRSLFLAPSTTPWMP
jgi:SNF2 family DNA or RNA helicase